MGTRTSRNSATTTHAIRAATQRLEASIQVLSERYSINPKTVAKWRKPATTWPRQSSRWSARLCLRRLAAQRDRTGVIIPNQRAWIAWRKGPPCSSKLDSMRSRQDFVAERVDESRTSPTSWRRASGRRRGRYVETSERREHIATLDRQGSSIPLDSALRRRGTSSVCRATSTTSRPVAWLRINTKPDGSGDGALGRAQSRSRARQRRRCPPDRQERDKATSQGKRRRSICSSSAF